MFLAARISVGKACGLSGHVALPVVWNLGRAKQRKEDERPRPRTGAVESGTPSSGGRFL